MANADANFLACLFGRGPLRYGCVGELLAVQVLKGRNRLEDFDNPLPGSSRPSDADYARHNLTPVPHRNLARDWIESNPSRWDAMLRTAMAQELGDVNPPAYQ